MKKLLSLLIITILFIACKQKTKDTSITSKQKKVIVEKSTTQKLKSNDNKKVEAQTIDEFLKQLQKAVKNNDIKTIKKSLKFPVTFSSGGEEISYINLEEMVNDYVDDEFGKITEAKLIDREKTRKKGYDKDYYQAVYIDHSIDPSIEGEYTITFFILKEKESFKLVSFQEPF